jgi:Ser/Thr protein kinase RdoA (MazF antagonist)
LVSAPSPGSIVHCDLSAWNVRFTGGRLSALYDFDAADVDARAADVACARRGYHDVFVEGYREGMELSAEELAALGSLWRANVLRYVTNLLRAGISTDEWRRSELEWCRAQLDKTVPYVNVEVTRGADP